MSYIPHTPDELKAMLHTIGVANIDDLFDEIPRKLFNQDFSALPEALSELALTQMMALRVPEQSAERSFVGAGAYHHYVPAVVWALASRGEFLTAYTPYQAEASQGMLQLLFEFQSMMARLLAMDVANASMYDGATALCEAVLMALRLKKNAKEQVVYLPEHLHPHYLATLQTFMQVQKITSRVLPFDSLQGTLDFDDGAADDMAVLVMAQPSYFGTLESVDEWTNWAHAHGAKVVALVNPLLMSCLKPPGQWGIQGADIACGEAQPLGIPLSSGGPYLGFMACRQSAQRQLPGRVVGMTDDREGCRGFVLTLQTREQHIRRGKATSNICTNQGLLAVAASIYMSVLGDGGLSEVAWTCHQRWQYFLHQLREKTAINLLFSGAHFYEGVLCLPSSVISQLKEQGYHPGQDVSAMLGQEARLVCVTETKSPDHVDDFVDAIKDALEMHGD